MQVKKKVNTGSVDLDEILQNATSHLGLHCLLRCKQHDTYPLSAHVYILKDQSVCYGTSLPKNGDCNNMQYALLKTLVVKKLQAKNVYERGRGGGGLYHDNIIF